MPLFNPPSSGTGAPTDAKYIVQVAHADLSAEQELAALATGLVKNTTTTGVLSIAAGGTDYARVNTAADVPNLENLNGTLTIAKGGTGQTGATAAFDALAPTTTQGDLIYHDGSDNVRLAKGTALHVLRMNSGATAPEWAAASGGAFMALLGQVFVSITKTNIGNAYADIYVTAFDAENLLKIDFTGITSVRAVFLWDYVGTGTQQVRWVDVADNNNVLIESATFSADQDPGDTGWVSLPAAFANATKQIEWQGKSTTAGDDPVPKGYALYGK